MTNRIEYPIPSIDDYPTPEQDIKTIVERLGQINKPLTLDNATDVLTQCLSRSPDAWAITLADLPALWVELVEKPAETA